MTPEEREAAGIITVPRSQLQDRATELGLSDATVQGMMESDESEFYFTSAVPSCVMETPEESGQEYGSKDALLDAIAEKISVSEKIVAAFSEDGIRDLRDSREIVAKHTVRLEGLRALDRLVRLVVHGQDSLERAYDMYWNLVGRANHLVSNFGSEVLLKDVSSSYIREALSRGPAIISDTLDGLRASAMNGPFGTLGDGEALLVGGDWLNGSAARMRMISDVASSGHPIIMSGDGPDALSAENIGLSTAFSGSAGVYGLWHDEESGVTYCYSDSGGDLNDSIESAFEWAEGPQANSSIPEQYLAPIDSVTYSLTKTHGNFGDLKVETEYDMIEIQSGIHLVVTHYKLTGDANVSNSFWDNWTAVADLRVSGQHSHSNLVGHSPTSNTATSGTQQVYLFHSDPHYDWEYGTGWTYSMGDAVFHDLTSQNSFSLWYDVNECQANDGNSYTIEPGTFTEAYASVMDAWIQDIEDGVNANIPNEDDWITIKPFRYSETEHYSVTFFRDRTLLPDQTETVSCDITATLM